MSLSPTGRHVSRDLKANIIEMVRRCLSLTSDGNTVSVLSASQLHSHLIFASHLATSPDVRLPSFIDLISQSTEPEILILDAQPNGFDPSFLQSGFQKSVEC